MWWLSLLQQKLPHKPRWNRFEKLFFPIQNVLFLFNPKSFFSILFPISKCVFFPNQLHLPPQWRSSGAGRWPSMGGISSRGTSQSMSTALASTKRAMVCLFLSLFVFVFVFEINKGCLCLWMSTNLGSTKVVMVYLALCILEFPKFQSLNSDFWVSLSFTISMSKF